MDTTRKIENDITPELMADAQIVADCVAAGKPIPPEVANRVRERSEQIKQRVFEKFGLLDIGVPAIRELRGELPKP